MVIEKMRNLLCVHRKTHRRTHVDPQQIIHHICFYDMKPTRKPKMFTGDQMMSRQFGGWKQVT